MGRRGGEASGTERSSQDSETSAERKVQVVREGGAEIVRGGGGVDCDTARGGLGESSNSRGDGEGQERERGAQTEEEASTSGQAQPHLTSCIHVLVLESQLLHKIVN